MIGRYPALLLIAGSVLLAPVCAQTPADDTRTSTLPPDTTLTPRPPPAILAPKEGAGTGNLITYFVVLVVFAAGGIYLIKRGLPLRGAKSSENHLQLLETKMLGNRQFLVVVRYQDNKMLLGVGPGQIQYLCPLDSADEDLEKLVGASGVVSTQKLG